MTKYELIDHLIGIREYSIGMVAESELEDVWLKDVEVITEVIELIQKYVP
jgi:hypothetical protein